jgi:hypothetical protein
VRNAVQVFIVGTFVAIIAVVVFVKAGAKSGVSGGTQTATIVSAAGDSYAKVVTALEGG